MRKKVGRYFDKEDVPLNIAVWKVREEIKSSGGNPSADDWTLFDFRRKEIYERVLVIDPSLCDRTMDDVVLTYLQIRKSIKRRLIIQYILTHGCECFYCSRVPTPCGGGITLDRIKPGNRGGLYLMENLVLACRSHNSQRGKLSIEDFISSQSRT